MGGRGQERGSAFYATLVDGLQQRRLCEICGAIYPQMKAGNPERKTLQEPLPRQAERSSI